MSEKKREREKERKTERERERSWHRIHIYTCVNNERTHSARRKESSRRAGHISREYTLTCACAYAARGRAVLLSLSLSLSLSLARARARSLAFVTRARAQLVSPAEVSPSSGRSDFLALSFFFIPLLSPRSRTSLLFAVTARTHTLSVSDQIFVILYTETPVLHLCRSISRPFASPSRVIYLSSVSESRERP